MAVILKCLLYKFIDRVKLYELYFKLSPFIDILFFEILLALLSYLISFMSTFSE